MASGFRHRSTGNAPGSIFRHQHRDDLVAVPPVDSEIIVEREHRAADRVRTVRDSRFKLIRNFEPQRPYLQRMAYAEVTNPAYNRMRQLFAEGKLNADQSKFMAAPRPAEELYDLQNDPFELRNIADDPAHRATLQRLRTQLDAWIADTHDQGVTPEDPKTVAEDLKRNEAADKKLRTEFGLGEHGVRLRVPQQSS